MSVKKAMILSVLMNGELVGHWQVLRNNHQFSYAESWYEFAGRRPISLSLPLQYFGFKHTGDVVENYFDNLLPDNIEIRKRFQSRFSIPTIKTFDLLYEIGRDCIGAIQLLPQGEEIEKARSVEGKIVSNNEIEQILKSVTSKTVFSNLDHDDFRISLAGAQEKTALTKYKDRWLIPEGATPSTHIFKLPLGVIGQSQIDLSSSIENEWITSRIFEQFNLPVAKSEICKFGDTKTLVVQRFDRKLTNDNYFIRIPQEDLCQVMGIPSGLKYENDGGIGIQKIMEFLLGSKSSTDRNDFFMSQILFWLLAAPDGHAKNFSVFIEPLGQYRLTPFYDIISAYPILGKSANEVPPEKLKMAMSVTGKNKHYKWRSITYRHWIETGKICGLSTGNVNNMIDMIIETATNAIDKVNGILPLDFPTEIAEKIFEGFLSSVKNMKGSR